MVRFILAVLLIFGIARVASAQTPEETIRWIYVSSAQPGPASAQGLDYLSSPAQRSQFFSRRMVAFYEANDSYGGDLSQACVDFGFAIPGQDYDGAEILQTLVLTTSGNASRLSVIARFSNFGQPAQITYDFVAEDGLWKIDDIAGPGWRASEIPCTPKVAGAATGAAYCYQTDADNLRLEVQADGNAYFNVFSWQSNGHSCAGQGFARVVEGGWLYEEDLSGRICRLGISVTPDQGLRLSDPDFACKMWMCGQRASLDGLSFPRTSQVDCRLMRDDGN